MCCLIRAVLHPVWSAASDPVPELYKINFDFQSKILFKRISYAYNSALDNSDPSVFSCLSYFYWLLIQMRIHFLFCTNPDPIILPNLTHN